MPSTLVRHTAGEQFVQNQAQGIHVAARIELCRIRSDLLGTHVRQGPDEFSKVRSAGDLRIAIGDARDAEIQNFRLPGFIDQDVARLQIAMNNAAVVSLLRGLADLDDQIQALRRRQAVSGGILEQRVAMDSVHGEERSSTHDSGFENLRDAGMLETPERMRFLREAAENFRNSQAGLHHFEGDDSARTLLFGFVHNAHSTLADETDDAIGAEINGWARLGTPVRNLFEKSRSGDVLIEEGLD